MRLKERRARLRDPSYLVHRYLWSNLEAAVREAKQSLSGGQCTVLDIGCGQRPYADLFQDCNYIGLNNSTVDASPDVVGDAARLPFATGSIHLVFCTQVLEHVPKPWLLMQECARVLRPGGWLVLSAPFYWPLHEEPYDYFRFTRYGLEQLLMDAGFTECQIREDGGDYARLWLSVLHAMPRWLNVPLRLPLNVIGSVMDRLFPRATLPANYTVLARIPQGS